MRAELASLVTCLALVGCGTLNNLGTTLELDVSGQVLRMDGTINSQSLRQFNAVLEENPTVTSVEMGEIQGSLDDEIVAEMGYVIRDLGLSTRMGPDAQVFSGGVDLFLAGSDRRIAPGAIVGVHEWKSGLGRGRDYPRGDPEHEPTRGYIQDMLGTDAFYWFTLQAASFEDVHVMSRDELVRYGVVTQ